jgi:formylglycine-generating enzyme required for sulfatase activity
MLSGKLPFEGDNPHAVMMKRVTTNPINLRAAAPQVSESVERAVMAALEREPQQRTPSVQAFAEALTNAVHTGTQMFGGRATERFADGQGVGVTVDAGPDAMATRGDPAMTQVLTAESARGTLRGASSGSAAAAPPELTINDPGFNTRRTDPTRQETTSKSESKARSNTLLIAGPIALVIVAVALYFVLSATHGELVITGIPAGADVFINDVKQDVTVSRGSVTIPGLDLRRALNVRVSKQGFADFTDVLATKKEKVTLKAVLLPLEIDHEGSMVLVNAGEFVMGDNNGQADERPVHKVNLPAYYIDKYEVTNALYSKFCDATGTPRPPDPPTMPGYFDREPQGPVLGVTIDQAKAYAKWAGKRLPTEEEWEKAASWDPSVDKKRKWPWGEGDIQSHANIGTKKPAPVSEFGDDRSAYGVFGMSGNAAEWVDATYKPYEGGTSPSQTTKGYGLPMIRGGTFLDATTLNSARTSYRNFLPKDFPPGFSTPVGIRCAISADDPRIQQQIQARNK